MRGLDRAQEQELWNTKQCSAKGRFSKGRCGCQEQLGEGLTTAYVGQAG